MVLNKEKEELELLPIYEKDLIENTEDVFVFPILATDIKTETEKFTIEVEKKNNDVPSDLERNKKNSLEGLLNEETVLRSSKKKVVVQPEPKATVVARNNTTTPSDKNSSVLEALKKCGRYPTRKDEQKNVVPNMEVINKAENAVPANENVLFAYYSFVTYCKAERVKPAKNAIVKLPFMDNQSRVILITESSIIIASVHSTEKEAIVIPLNEVVNVSHVFEKKLTTVGQTQILLSDGNILVITIDKVIGGKPDQTQFDEFKEGIDRCIARVEEPEDLEAQGFLSRAKELEEIKEIVVAEEGDRLFPDISMEDRFVLGVLFDIKIDYLKECASSPENRNMNIQLVIETCINKKMNELFRKEMYSVFNFDELQPDEEVPEELIEAMRILEKSFTTDLNEQMLAARLEFRKIKKV